MQRPAHAPPPPRPPRAARPTPVARRSLVGLGLAGASALWLAPELVGLAETTPFPQLAAFRPVTAAGQLALAALTVTLRRRWWPSALLVGGAAAVALGAVLPRAIPTDPPPPGRELSILSFNVWHGRADVAALADTIRRERPDLVVLPEAGARYLARLDPPLEDTGYRSWSTHGPEVRDGKGVAVLAAARLGALTVTPLDVPGARFRWMTLAGGTLGDVRVVAVHTSAPVPRWMPGWGRELRALHTWLGPGAGPHVVVGDVNATLDHAPLRAGLVGARDVAADRGAGLTATWPTRWPRWLGAQIDHVFTTAEVTPADARVLTLPGSDHRALLARVVLPHA